MKNKGNLTKEQKIELDRRYANYQKRIGRTYIWEETIAFTDHALTIKKLKK